MKRVLAILLSMTLLLSLMTPVALAAEEEDVMEADTTQMALLDDILPGGDRVWVLETLLHDNRENNPMAKLQNYGERSMATVTLEKYRDGLDDSAVEQTRAWLYRQLVLVITALDDPAQYANDIKGQAEALISAGVFASDAELQSTVDLVVNAAGKLTYEQILYSAYTSKITASNGDAVGDVENSLVNLRQTQSALKYLQGLMSLIKTDTNAGNSAATLEYVDKYALPYAKAAKKYLKSMQEGDEGMQMASALTALAYYSAAAPVVSLGGFAYDSHLERELDEWLTKEVIGTTSELMSTAGTALNTYLAINGIQQQKESLGTLLRAADFYSGYRGDIAASVRLFCGLMDQEYSADLNNETCWATLAEMLRSKNVVADKVTEVAGDAMKDFLKKSAEANEISALSLSQAQSIGEALDIAIAIADEAIGLTETCKKTYELLCWEELMELFISQCNADIVRYNNEKTEENAAMVLDDLLLLQRMRLYGEKIAYGMSSAQLDSWLGKMYAGENSAASWKIMYQRSIDTLMAASVAPAMNPITVGTGETLLLTVDSEGEITANIQSPEEGTAVRYYVELEKRLGAGVELGHMAKMNIINRSLQPAPIGCITSESGDSISVLTGDVCIGDLSQGAGYNLDIILAEDTAMEIGRAGLQWYTITAEDNQPLQVRDLDLSKMSKGANGLVEVSGNIWGPTESHIWTTGMPTLHLVGEEQTIYNELWTKELQLLGERVTVEGKIYVDETLYAKPDCEIRQGENIWFQGSEIQGGYFDGDLTVRQATVENVTIEGSLYDAGQNSYQGNVEVEELILIGRTVAGSSPHTTIENDCDLTVNELLDATNGGIGGGGTLRLKGDMTMVDTELTVYLEGSGTQRLTNSTVGTLVSHSSGAVITDGLRVSSYLEDESGSFAEDSWVSIKRDGTLGGEQFGGSLYLSEVTVENSVAVEGGIANDPAEGTMGNIEIIGGELDVAGALTAEYGVTLRGSRLSVGSATVERFIDVLDGATFTVKGDATLQQSLTVGAGSHVTVEGNLNTKYISGSREGMVRVKGDLSATVLGGSNTQNTSAYGAALPVWAEGNVTVTGNYSHSNVRLIVCGTEPQTLTAGMGFFQLSDLILANTSAEGVSIVGVSSNNFSVRGVYAKMNCPVTENVVKNGTAYGLPENQTVVTRIMVDGDAMQVRACATVAVNAVPLTAFYKDGRLMGVVCSEAAEAVKYGYINFSVAIPEGADACVFFMADASSFAPLGVTCSIPLL